MGAIELKMAILTGAVGGVLLMLAELVFMHRRVAAYRAHLRRLHGAGRKVRLAAELAGVAAIALAQPILIALLVVTALGNFNPRFSANAAQQLQAGGQVEERPLRSDKQAD